MRKFNKRLWLLLFISVSAGANAQTSVSGDQSGTWTLAGSPYIIDGSVTIPDGQTLTIQPGVIIRFSNYFSSVDVYGTLNAQGIAADSIKFLGTKNESYDYAGYLNFAGNSTNSVLNYVVMDSLFNPLTLNAPCIISHTTLKNCFNTGVNINIAVNISNSSFSGIIGDAIYINDNVKPVITANTFSGDNRVINTNIGCLDDVTGNINAEIQLTRGSFTDINSILPQPGTGSLYSIPNNVYIDEGKTLTINPGVTIKFINYYSSIEVYGTLISQGTPADSIKFLGTKNESYDYAGYLNFGTTSTNSVLDYVVMDSLFNALTLNAPCAISHTTLKNSFTTGVYINGAVNISNSSFSGIIGDAIYINDNVKPVITANTFSGDNRVINTNIGSLDNVTANTNANIQLTRGGFTDINSVLPQPGTGSLYSIPNNVYIDEGKTLTINPGVSINFISYYSSIEVYGTLNAQGTPADSIKFLGTKNESYDYAGYLNFAATSTNSVMDYVVMDSLLNYPSPGYAALILNGPCTISHTTLKNCFTGVYINNAVYISNSSFSDIIGDAIYINDNVKPVITGNTFSGDNRVINTNIGSLDNVTGNFNADIQLTRGSFTDVNSVLPQPGTGSLYSIPNNVNIDEGKTLTIAPGVAIKFINYYSSIEVNGTLNAQGSVTDSVKFIGTKNESFDYAGYLNFGSTSINSVFDYVVMDSLFNYQGVGWATLILNAPCTISHTTLKNCFTTGVYINNAVNISSSSFASITGSAIQVFSSSANISNCSFSGIIGDAIYINDNVKPVITGNTFSGNNRVINTNIGSLDNVTGNINADIQLTRGSFTDVNSVLPKPGTGSLYSIPNNVFIDEGKTLTIDPGVTIKFINYYSSIEVYGTLIAQGTPADSIKFLGTKNESDDYAGYLNFAGTSLNSVLDYVVLDSLFNNQWVGSAALILNAPCSISHTTLRNCFTTGVYAANNAVTILNSAFIKSGSVAIVIPENVEPTITGNIFGGNTTERTIQANPGSVSNLSGNSNAIIELNGNVTHNTSWKKPGPNSIYKAASVTVDESKILTIQPGAEIEVMLNQFTVYGTLIANGTVTDSIRFFGKASESYSHGGWMVFQPGSENSSLSYAVIDSLGGYSSVAIHVSGPLTISHSSILNSKAYGLQIDCSDVTITNCSFAAQNQDYQSVYLLYDTISPTIQHTVFSGNIPARTIYASPGNISNLADNTNAIIELYGNVKKNATWQKPGPNSIYKAAGVVVDWGKTLTIQPGSNIEVMPNQFIVYGTLIAHGSITDSIRFFGKANDPYTHGGTLVFDQNSSNSSLSYVAIDSLGELISSLYHAIRAFGPLNISNSSIRNSKGYSIWIEGSPVNISNSSFSAQDQQNQAIYITQDTISPTIQNNFFSGNDYARTIELGGLPNAVSNIADNTNAIIPVNGTINRNITFSHPGPNSKYIISSTLIINASNTLTIEPGTLVDFRDGNGNIIVNGNLRAQGTESAPIQFVKLPGNGPSSHGGTVSFENTGNNSVLSYVNIDKLGQGGQAVQIFTPNISFSNVNITNSAQIALYVASNGNQIITNSNFSNNPYGIYNAAGKPVFTNCNIFGNSFYGIYNESGNIEDTVDARNCWWGDVSGPLHAVLNPFGLGNEVTDKVKFDPSRNQPSDNQVIDIGVSALVSPVSNCGLTAEETIKIRIHNYGNITQSGFTVRYQINNGSLITENVGSVSLLPGSFIDYSFIEKANLSGHTIYQIKTFTSAAADSTSLNDTVSAAIQHFAGLTAPANLLPIDSSINVDNPINFSWSAVTNAASYNLYIWKSSDPVPAIPTVAGLTQINYSYFNSDFVYGSDYKWKVVALRDSCNASSSEQNFSLRFLPDLVVDSITVPPTGTSESDIIIHWRIKNQGPGTTGTKPWNEYVYLSDATQLGITNDYFLGSFDNLSALNAGESYQAPDIAYRIPQGVQGLHYIIITTNANGSVKEISDSNNIRVSDQIAINLSPPPDLQVTFLTASPATIFSEDSITVNWTVKNNGTGPTTINPDWTDDIYLSTDNILNINNAILLDQASHSGSLNNGAEYTATRKLKMPAQVNGTYYIHVFTDIANNIFEYSNEDNNTAASLPLNVILRPAPDLAIHFFSMATATISTGQAVNIEWAVRNEGAAPAVPYWQDEIILSTDMIYNAGSDLSVYTHWQNDTLPADAVKSSQVSVSIPAGLAEGNYFLFIKTDGDNSVFEAGIETNNLSSSTGPIIVVRPDLSPVSVQHSSTAQSGQVFSVSWKIKNNGRGNLFNAQWDDKVYLSGDTVLNISTDVLLSSVLSASFIPVNGQYTRQQTLMLPEGIEGVHYLFIVADEGNTITENNEANNTISSPVTISLSAWPDLQVNNIQTAAEDTAATFTSISYNVKNSGTAAIINKTWVDRIYLSPTNNINESNLVFLKEVSQQRSLIGTQSYTIQTSVQIPSYVTPGPYYLIIITDADSLVFEHTSENNNRGIGQAIMIHALPNIDLAVQAGTVSSAAVIAGQTIQSQWFVQNAGATSTIITFWEDAVYLSNNPVLDASDQLLGVWTVNTTLVPGATYTQIKNISIPNTVSGNLYLLVVADRYNQQNDLNRGNNVLALNTGGGSGGTITITQPSPPDLIPLALETVSEAFAAQPIDINFSVGNNGPGNTTNSIWTEAVYLSSDFHLGSDDIQIGNHSRSGVLLAGNQYSDTLRVFLPAELSGNYVLIFKTDADNKVYEPNAETNNLAFVNIFIRPQLPSDLIVNTITLPSPTQLAGSDCTVEWKLKNNSSITAQGYMQEAVYLSKDPVWDNSDVLFGTMPGFIQIAPQSILNRQLSNRLKNVVVGDYYVIIRSDILNNITETNENNNISVSRSTFEVNVQELVMQVITADTLVNDQSLYYRLEIPAGLVNETLSLTVKGDSARNAVNRLYLSYNKVPTQNEYDYSSLIPFKANQEIIVPELKEGSYYLMALGHDTSVIKQAATFLAKTIPFQITMIDADKGGNTGSVTMKITGARFEQGMTIRLEGFTNVTADNIFYINSTKVFARFNLSGVPLGTYTVRVTRANATTTTLSNSFEVVQGIGSLHPLSGSVFTCQVQNIGYEDNMETDVLSPASVRVGRIVSIIIAYENTGNIDIPAPKRLLISLEGMPINFVPVFTDRFTTLSYEFIEIGGPPGVLRAGASGFVKIFAIAERPPNFTLLVTE